MLEEGIDISDTQPKLLTDKTVEMFKPVIILGSGLVECLFAKAAIHRGRAAAVVSNLVHKRVEDPG